MAHDNQIHYYGKGDVFVYRTHVAPLTGVRPIAESPFTGRPGLLLAANVTLIARGAAFYKAYSEGENRHVVATDSMKNFILREAAAYEGATLEGLLAFVGERFLEKYPQVESVRISADEVPFAAVPMATEGGYTASDLVLRATRGDYATASLELDRSGIIAHESGLRGLQLLKVSGSSFAGFVRDEYTTLPEAHDRALFTFIDLAWGYGDAREQQGGTPERYVPAEQVRDLASAVFHQTENRSIQHLIYEMGRRMLERFPSLATVRFEAQNRTWETVVDRAKARVYTDPRPPYGVIGLTLNRSDIA